MRWGRNACRVRSRALSSAIILAVTAPAVFSPQASGARLLAQHTISPLPASNYSARAACGVPAPGRYSCLAVELVPKTAAARSHNHPLGIPRKTAAAVATSVCEPPTAAQACYGLRPQDLHSAYQLPTTSGSTQTIAIVDAYDDPNAEADLRVYDEEFKLPACNAVNGCFRKVNENGNARPLPPAEGNWALEISLDIEVAHAVCQNCHIVLVEASDETNTSLEAAEETAATVAGATEISNSWAGEEPTIDSSAFNHPGVAIVAASGDWGYLNWVAPYPEEQGLVSYPASSPHVLAVGGTRLTLSSEGAWAGETVWNGGAYSVTPSGGAAGSGCSARFTAPSWQQALANWSSVGCGTSRAVADVSADADPYTGVAIYDSTPIPEQGAPNWTTIGGTSLSSPLIAATIALAGGAGGAEYPAKTVYEKAVSKPASLHDVTTGSNGYCGNPSASDGTSGCTESEEAASCSAQAICLAGAGYDGPTGLGAPDGLGAFERATEPRPQTLTFTSSAPTKASFDGSTYTVSAVSSSGLAVSLSSGTPSVCSLNGSASGSAVSFVGVGTCTIDASQAGDADYEPAPAIQQTFTVGKSQQQITITSVAPSGALVGDPAYVVSATASSGLPVAFSSETPSVCSVAGSSVKLVGAGTCTIEAGQIGDPDYEPAPAVEQSFTVQRRTQSVEFVSTAPSAATVGGSSYSVSAKVTSGLPVALSSATPSVCVLEGTNVTFDGVGTCTVDAGQSGNFEYAPASQAEQAFLVGPAPLGGSPLPSVSPPSVQLPSISLPGIPPPNIPPTTSATAVELDLVGVPAVNHKTGAVTFTAISTGPGTVRWLLTFPNGKFGVFSARAAKCARGQIVLRRKCEPAKVVYAKGREKLTAAGTVELTVRPSAAAKAALKRAGKLAIAVTLTFQPAYATTAVTHTLRIEVTVKRRSR